MAMPMLAVKILKATTLTLEAQLGGAPAWYGMDGGGCIGGWVGNPIQSMSCML